MIGKGRKERCVPLAKPKVAVLKAWLREPPRGDGQVLSPNVRGSSLTPDGEHHLLVRKAKPLNGKFKRYRPGDHLLGFLNNL